MSNLVQDLVLSYRILAEHGVVDAYGHVSVRSEQNPNRYLLSRALAPELVTEADIMEFDLDSNPLDRQGRGIYLERFIHGEIYKLRPDVQAIVHNHSPSVIPFGVTTVQMKPLFNTGAFVGLGIPTFEIRDFQPSGDIIVKTPHLGHSLATVLAGKPAALMRGHGSVVVGDSLPAAVIRSIYLELSAKLQMQAMTIAGPSGKIVYLDEAEVAETTARQDSARTWERTWDLWRTKALAQLQLEKQLRA
ncbi:MAG: class aldolase/adducin-like protein [Rhodospirillales bacterium]|jgi:HCOMODA/2-hydroxy-3-carboxy-muconic semialdehyde decarboxylase|nr:class aldolase/adducin-like protein [Rhodospirillales bacterium]